MSRVKFLGWTVGWLLLLGLAFTLDEWCARLPRVNVPGEWWLTFVRLTRIYWPGHFLSTILLASLIGCFSRRDHWRRASLLLLAGSLVLVVGLLKWFFGRGRPVNGIAPWTFHPFHGHPGGPNQSMPSGDAALAWAMTVVLCRMFPRGWIIWCLFGIFVAAQRVMVNAHYLSDVVAGAGVGAMCALVAERLLKSSFDAAPRRGDAGAAVDTMSANRPEPNTDNHG